MNRVKIAGIAVSVTFLFSALNFSTARSQEKGGQDKPALYLQWMKEAEKGEHRDEKQYLVGFAFYHGTAGAKRDWKKAFEWFLKAAKNGNSSAHINLGDMYRLNYPLKKDTARAMRYYKKAADLGNYFGMEKLGDIYCYGSGVKENYFEAAKWYKKAIKKSFTSGPYAKLAELYYQGTGVKKNHNEALKLFLKAEKLGAHSIYHYIADIYEDRKNYTEAEKWLLKGATGGDTLAMYYLAKMYAPQTYPKGKGVPKNYVNAHTWLTVLTEKEFHPRAEKLLRQVERKMTRPQISKAKRLAYPLIKDLVTDDDREWKEYSKTLKKS